MGGVCSGYPQGRGCDQLSLGARIMQVADVRYGGRRDCRALRHQVELCLDRLGSERDSLPLPADLPLTNSSSVPPPSFPPSGVNFDFSSTSPSGMETVPGISTSASSKS